MGRGNHMRVAGWANREWFTEVRCKEGASGEGGYRHGAQEEHRFLYLNCFHL